MSRLPSHKHSLAMARYNSPCIRRGPPPIVAGLLVDGIIHDFPDPLHHLFDQLLHGVAPFEPGKDRTYVQSPPGVSSWDRRGATATTTAPCRSGAPAPYGPYAGAFLADVLTGRRNHDPGFS
jgi:hypothetical protein